MLIAVALDSPRDRDLAFYRGDRVTIELLVYERDGNETPIDAMRITNARFVFSPGAGVTFLVGTAFTVPDDCAPWRAPYRLVAEIDGNTTTLCAGLIRIKPESAWSCWGWRNDYGWMWPWA